MPQKFINIERSNLLRFCVFIPVGESGERERGELIQMRLINVVLSVTSSDLCLSLSYRYAASESASAPHRSIESSVAFVLIAWDLWLCVLALLGSTLVPT